MVRKVGDNDADGFMPDKRDVVVAGKRIGNKQKIPGNRGSQERLTWLYNNSNDDQKVVANLMGIQALMNLKCTNLNNIVCDWLGRLYEPKSKEFGIPGRGRMPLDEDSVFSTLGVPVGNMP